MQRTSFFPKRETTRPENFPFRVTGYDTTKKPHSVTGVRIDNGDEVKVVLRDIRDLNITYQGSNVRAEIADFAAPRAHNQHPGTEVGGILLAQEAFKQADGSFAARWIQSLSHRADEAHVFVALAHVSELRTAKPKGDGTPPKKFSMMTFLHDGAFGDGVGQAALDALSITPPMQVGTGKDLGDITKELLADGLGVGVRLSSDQGFDAIYVSRGKDETEEVAVGRMMESVKGLLPAIESGDIKCEIIPYGNVFSGPKTTDIMAKNKVVQGRLNNFHAVREGDDGKTYPVTVFRPTIVAVRLTKPDEHGKQSAFFTHFEPLYNQQPIHGLVNAICYAKTELLKPEVPAPNVAAPKAKQENQSEGQPEARQSAPEGQKHDPRPTPPAATGMDDGSFTADSDFDDLMEAASATVGHDIDVPAESMPAPTTSTPGRQFRRRPQMATS
ncbi:MAG: hypothetical protein O9327_05100 [Polaromonas sp.]|nr:hypothetical protein [Polaromonas sp.]